MDIFALMIGRSLTIPFAINLERTEKQQQREPELAPNPGQHGPRRFVLPKRSLLGSWSNGEVECCPPASLRETLRAGSIAFSSIADTGLPGNDQPFIVLCQDI
jgi:hypothetical protein